MFNSVILDVAIGLVFIYLFFSIVASAVKEAISGYLKWRAKDLKEGIAQLLSDRGFVNQLYDHPLIQSMVKGGPDFSDASKDRNPSYIPSRIFAQALWQLYNDAKQRGESAQWIKTVDSVLTASGVDVQQNLKSLETWFDDGMDRVSGWYKRNIQYTLFIIAAVIVVLFNVDSFKIVTVLYTDETIRNGLASEAIKFKEAYKDASDTAIASASANVQEIYNNLKVQRIPIGWEHSIDHYIQHFNTFASLLTLAGWMISALAISMGAPFWFDLISKFINLRHGGEKPKKSKDSETTSSATPPAPPEISGPPGTSG